MGGAKHKKGEGTHKRRSGVDEDKKRFRRRKEIAEVVAGQVAVDVELHGGRAVTTAAHGIRASQRHDFGRTRNRIEKAEGAVASKRVASSGGAMRAYTQEARTRCCRCPRGGRRSECAAPATLTAARSAPTRTSPQ